MLNIELGVLLMFFYFSLYFPLRGTSKNRNTRSMASVLAGKPKSHNLDAFRIMTAIPIVEAALVDGWKNDA